MSVKFNKNYLDEFLLIKYTLYCFTIFTMQGHYSDQRQMSKNVHILSKSASQYMHNPVKYNGYYAIYI